LKALSTAEVDSPDSEVFFGGAEEVSCLAELTQEAFEIVFLQFLHSFDVEVFANACRVYDRLIFLEHHCLI